MDSVLKSHNARCRTCFEIIQTNLQSLHEATSYSEKSLSDLLLEVAKIDTKCGQHDEMPQHICENCSEKLKSAYCFVQQAQRVNERLLASVGGEKTEYDKSLDCLLEAPIDIVESLEIKMETDFGDESVYDALNAFGLPAEIKSKTATKLGVDKADTFLKSMKQEQSFANGDDASFLTDDAPSSSNAVNLDDMPLSLRKTRFMSKKAKNAKNIYKDLDESDYELNIQDITSDSPATPPKRRRGRPRLSKSDARPQLTSKRHSCNVCNKTFAWKKDLQRHLKTHSDMPALDCDYCERKFLRKDKLNDHMKMHLKRSHVNNQILRTPNQPAQNFAERLYSNGGLKQIQCKLCSSDFKRTHDLRAHLLTHLEPDSLQQLSLNSYIVKELFPLAQQLDEIKSSICIDIKQQSLAKFYAVVNEYGYEISLSDTDVEDDDAAHKVNKERYECELCQQSFEHKHQIFAHTKQEHCKEPLPHKCTVCKLEFVCQRMFNIHSRTQCRSKEKKYQCIKCPGKFMWVENLETHQCPNRFNTHKRRRDVLQCSICNKTFVWLKDLKRHTATHDADGGLQECSICCQQFLKAENLRQHLRQAHGEQHKRSLQCCLCNLKCEKLLELREHLQLHADGTTGINMSEALYFQKFHEEGVQGFESQISNSIAAAFSNNSLTRFYSAIDESGNELELSDSETDTNDDTRDVNESLKTLSCELCAQAFTRRKHIRLHQYTEHADDVDAMSHVCTHCKKQYVCLTLLQQHLKRDDCLNTTSKFQCEKCPARFVWQENLKFHMQLKHINTERQISRQLANKLQCDQCDKVFIWAKDLTRHRRIHMPDDEKYECSYCERKFHRKDNLHSHLKVHGLAAYESVCNKEVQRNKTAKVKEMDEHLCKPNGCKLIQCMICLSKHSKITDLHTHLRTHQYVVSFAQRKESTDEISALLYPEEPRMEKQALIEHIIADVSAQNLEHLYSITNEVGYELTLTSSETESDSEAEVNDEIYKNSDENNAKAKYTCSLCDISFLRKYKMFEHQMLSHEWQEANYICTHCNARFLSEKFLQGHYEQQCKNMRKRHMCRKCPYRFMWKDNLKIHLRTLHAESDEKKNKCADVPRSFDCLECKRSFRMQKDLTRHMVMHRADAFIFKCLWCPRKFYRKENMHMHIKRHGVTSDCLNTAQCLITATSAANGSKEIHCRVCNIRFERISALRAHLQQDANTAAPLHTNPNSLFNYSITNKLGFELQIDDSETDEENPTVNSTSVSTAIKTESNTFHYTCAICNLSCRRKYEMALHQRSMHRYESLPFKCTKCIFRTVSQDILSHHIRTQCSNAEKQFECSKCAFKFMWAENLENHMRLLHAEPEIEHNASNNATNESTAECNSFPVANKSTAVAKKLFHCDQCNRRYNRKDRLTAHIKKMHTGVAKIEKMDDSQIDPITGEKVKKAIMEKKFLCAFCGRAVTSSSNLIIHMRRHTGEKPFKCDFCDMAFPRSSDLQCHRRTHTGEKPHKCTVCDKAFSRSYKLQTHMRIHSGERPYQCNYCEKKFTQSNDLTLHIRRHTGERPYVCGICGERFIQGTALKNHRTMRGHFEDIEPRRSLLEQF